MNPKLTDEAVARLPLHHGRTELLEEIMNSPVLDDRPVRAEPTRRRTRWAVPAVGAAAVLALVAGSAALVSGLDSGPTGDRDTLDTPGVAGAPGAPVRADYRAVLDAPGWTVDGGFAETGYGEVFYINGEHSLTITWNPADSYEEYVEDRGQDATPPGDGESIEVLGLGAQLWDYGRRNYTAVREVEAGHWLELRAHNLGKAEYLQLLTQLRLVDRAGFEAAMPASFVDSGERTAAIDEILTQIGEHVDPLLPPGTQRASLTSDQTDPYHLGVDIAGGVACAWFAEFDAARQAGDQQRLDAAAAALGTTRDWPVLQEMAEHGGYSTVVWQLADQAVAGQVPDWKDNGLGRC